MAISPIFIPVSGSVINLSRLSINRLPNYGVFIQKINLRQSVRASLTRTQAAEFFRSDTVLYKINGASKAAPAISTVYIYIFRRPASNGDVNEAVF